MATTRVNLDLQQVQAISVEKRPQKSENCFHYIREYAMLSSASRGESGSS
jgi:hypothetical protein